MTWLGLDVGAKRTGVALSTSGRLVTPLGTLVGSLHHQLDALMDLIDRYEIRTIVVGVPDRPTTNHPTDRFVEALTSRLEAQTNPPAVAHIPEGLTTKEAERLLSAAGRAARDSDAVAAQLILEDYLNGNDQ